MARPATWWSALAAVANLLAQDPSPQSAAAPFDVAAFAARLAIAGDPPAVTNDLLPDGALERIDGTKVVTADELAWVLTLDSVARVATALRLLRADGFATAQELLDGVRASLVIGGGEVGRGEPARRLASVARQRGRALAARLLREFPDDLAVGHLLCIAWQLLPGEPGIPSVSEGLRRLGPRALPTEHLLLARLHLRAGELEAVDADLVAVAAAPPPPFVQMRAQIADALAELRHDVAEARRWRAAQAEAGEPGRLAHLRFLQATDRRAALELAQSLADAGFAHALPFEVLAAAALAGDDRAAARRWLDEARSRPHAGVMSVAAEYFLSVSAPPAAGEPPARRRERLAEVYHAADAELGADATPVAQQARKILQFTVGATDGATIFDSLDVAAGLWLANPDSAAAYRVTLAAVLRSDDAAAALAVLGRPLPPTLAALPDVVLDRAMAAVTLATTCDREDAGKLAARCCEEVERAQGDARDANLLRGLLTWSRGIRPGGDPADLEAARRMFAAARRRPFERGAWASAVACLLAEQVCGGAPDQQAANEVLDVGGLPDGTAMAALFAAEVAGGRADRLLPQLAELGERIDLPQARFVLASVEAARCAELGRADAARGAAARALELARTHPEVVALVGRGVLALRSCTWGLFASVSGPRVDCNLRSTLLPLPALPGEARLRELAKKP